MRLRITSTLRAKRWFHFLPFRPDDGSSRPMEPLRQLRSKGFVTHLGPTDASRPGQAMVQVTNRSEPTSGSVLKFFGGPQTDGAKRSRGAAARRARKKPR